MAQPHFSTPLWNTSRHIAVWGGGVAFLAGLAHLLMLPLSEAPWTGPVGLRKPAVFGISIGLTLWSLAWLVGFLRPRPRLHGVSLAVMTATLLIELAIIAGQRASGVPSHFNLGTPFDATLWTIMGAAIAVIAIFASIFAVLAWERLPGTAAWAAAVRSSLLIFALAQLSGQVLAVHGTGAVFVDGRFVAENLSTASTFGAAGNLKLPHALALHAIQVVPLLAFALARFSMAGASAALWVWTSALGYLGVAGVAQWQAFAGRAPADLTMPSAIILGVSLAAFLLPWVFVLGEALRRGWVRVTTFNLSSHA
jgi:hypothetical protein